MLNQNHKNQQGFTLMEAVVATSLFAFLVSSIIGVYIAAIRIDSKTRSERAVQQNARFIMEFLGKEIRNGRIHYSEYGGTVDNDGGNYTSVLHIVNQLDEQETITCNGDNITLTKDNGTTNLNSAGVRITRCAFYINPLTDPFQPLSSNPPNDQPVVTAVIQINANYGSRQNEQAVIDLQSSFAVRQYPSRQ